MEETAIIASLAAIAHDTRLKVFRLLVRVGPEGLASGEIARRLQAPASTMSAHLAILARTGLIQARRDSRIVNYTIAPEAVSALFAALVADCCEGRPDLCGPLLAPAKACAPKTSKTGTTL
ncbi:MAG: ArsR/SmtB family transcription factor [Caulobacterales bacterium]|jgi:DNA-binding transcriptional ArsR family regulator